MATLNNADDGTAAEAADAADANKDENVHEVVTCRLLDPVSTGTSAAGEDEAEKQMKMKEVGDTNNPAAALVGDGQDGSAAAREGEYEER